MQEAKDISRAQKSAIMKKRRRRERLFQMFFCASFYDPEDLPEMAERFIMGMRTHFKDEAYGEDIYVGREGDVTFSEKEPKTTSALLSFESGSLPRFPDAGEDALLLNVFLDIADKRADIDLALTEQTSGWSLERIGKVELTILRLALYEMYYGSRLPAGVAINEAVELAKAYGSEDSASFINGVLAKFPARDTGKELTKISAADASFKARKGKAKIIDVAKSPVKFPSHKVLEAGASSDSFP